jgi:hypothetical protein
MPTTIYDSSLITKRRLDTTVSNSFINRIQNLTNPTTGSAPYLGITQQSIINVVKNGQMTEYRKNDKGCTTISPGCPCNIPESNPAVPVGLTPANLTTIRNYLINYMSDFRTPNFYNYWCDGGAFDNPTIPDSSVIAEGGLDDMFDNGNIITPWLLSNTLYVSNSGIINDYPFRIFYDNITPQLVDTTFNYISLGYIPYSPFPPSYAPPPPTPPSQDPTFLPLTMIGYRNSGPVGWQIGGNVGADGTGQVIQSLIYNGAIINGFTVYAYYRQIYASINNPDPIICNLIILLGHPSWGSVFDTVLNFSEPTTLGCGTYFYTGPNAQNILTITSLLSRPAVNNTTPISIPELQTVVTNYILRIGQALGI